jgi:hypothetical protein
MCLYYFIRIFIHYRWHGGIQGVWRNALWNARTYSPRFNKKYGRLSNLPHIIEFDCGHWKVEKIEEV